ncbi:putative iron/manganese ABC transporter, permease protein [Haemophilus pittmaniae HK 85]|uniref:Putative iron/manganese ABC transporter, permease protein n=1 Tax=Haemophilus pittmaniae HK 85 TaxID=1035188 RepID=F9Q738_9PAST|nr:putative iron/manganese ABC transporter, permease protein [Haemophilus pittmaniae HK 85]
MLEYLLEPFSYEYMQKAMWLSAAVGGICAFLSAYLMLKGWSLIGDALSHSVVPGVAIAYAFSLPYALGAFLPAFWPLFPFYGSNLFPNSKKMPLLALFSAHSLPWDY